MPMPEIPTTLYNLICKEVIMRQPLGFVTLLVLLLAAQGSASAKNVASGNVTFLKVDGTCAYFELSQAMTVYAVPSRGTNYQQFYDMLLAAYMPGQTLTIPATNGTCSGSASPTSIYVGIYNGS